MADAAALLADRVVEEIVGLVRGVPHQRHLVGVFGEDVDRVIFDSQRGSEFRPAAIQKGTGGRINGTADMPLWFCVSPSRILSPSCQTIR